MNQVRTLSGHDPTPSRDLRCPRASTVSSKVTCAELENDTPFAISSVCVYLSICLPRRKISLIMIINIFAMFRNCPKSSTFERLSSPLKQLNVACYLLFVCVLCCLNYAYTIYIYIYYYYTFCVLQLLVLLIVCFNLFLIRNISFSFACHKLCVLFPLCKSNWTGPIV